MELYLRGDQIATIGGITSSCNANGVQVTLTGVQPLGDATTTFRVVIRQFNPNDPFFTNGQMIDIYAWPDSDPPAPPLYSSLNPGHDQYQGRASSGGHNIFSGGQILFQVDPILPGTIQYGPGATPPRSERLAFSSFPTDPPEVPCFVAGTLIETATGLRRLETIAPGDRVMTRDNGWQPVLWAGGRVVQGRGRFAPVRLRAGVLGLARDLLVSPQHRILLAGWPVQMAAGEAEVVAAARHLTGLEGIDRAPRDRVAHVHLLLPGHEALRAEGGWAESLWVGGRAVSGFGAPMRAELRAAIPPAERAGLHLVRPGLRGAEARRLVAAYAADLPLMAA